MSKATITKIKRLIGKIRYAEEISAIISAVSYRQETLKIRERIKRDKETFENVKHLKPGDTLVQSVDGGMSGFRDVGDTYTVVKVLPRLKCLLLSSEKGATIRYSMLDVRNMGLTDNPTPEIAAMALRKKIGAANGPSQSLSEFIEMKTKLRR